MNQRAFQLTTIVMLLCALGLKASELILPSRASSLNEAFVLILVVAGLVELKARPKRQFDLVRTLGVIVACIGAVSATSYVFHLSEHPEPLSWVIPVVGALLGLLCVILEFIQGVMSR